MIVMLHHASFVFATPTTFRLATELLLNAHAAVIVFFVLSGFVLMRALSGSHNALAEAPVFYVRRVFRIYPAIWMPSAFAAICLSFQPGFWIAQHSHWATYEYPANPPTSHEIIFSLLALKNRLLPPLWSVQTELIASLGMPFIAYALNKRWAPLILMLSALSPVLPGRSLTLFLSCFVVGAVASRETKWGRLVKPIPVLIGSALIMYFFRTINPHWRFEVKYGAIFPTVVEALAAGVMILSISSKEVSFLRRKGLVHLGDISYSVYLWHFPVLLTLSTALSRWTWPLEYKALALMAATTCVTIPVAYLSYNYIEIPGIALGKRVINAARNLSAMRRAANSAT